MNQSYNAWLEINLDAIEHNIKEMVKYVAPSEVMAVIKADACGHGALELAPTLINAGAKRVGVAKISEATELRNSGISVPLHVLGHVDPTNVDEVVENEMIVDPKNGKMAKKISKAATEKDKQVSVHIEIDTGLCRWGIPHDELERYIGEIKSLSGLSIDGIFTHFSSLDDGNFEDTERSFKVFFSAAKFAEKLLEKNLTKHVCNTIGTLALPHMHLDMVRPGVGLYGLLAYPIDSPFNLKPALSLKSKIGLIRMLKAGSPVGYGALHKLEMDTNIAVVPIGFGDGLPPQIGVNGEVLINGVRVPIIGKVSTDAVVLDVGKCRNLKPGDEVVFIGKSGNKIIFAEQLAQNLKTLVDPILINLGRGLNRIYMRQGLTVNNVY